MTISDYHVTMKAVGIAELKAKLSEHLRYVRSGESITVLDRQTPVARIVPYDAVAPGPLQVRRPDPNAPRLSEIPLPPPVDLDFDAVDLLLEDRGKR